MAELLAPAGSYETMLAVFEAGADAVYLAGELFGARAYAKNFTKEELLRALDYAHLHQKKIYLTVNTLLKEKEMEEKLYDYLTPFVEHGLDALLIQDIGLWAFAKRLYPGLELHASTQMSISSLEGARYLQDLGASRIVLSRELSLQEIKHIHEHIQAELEVFAHGALCYSYSGKCLMSSMIGGRSGNRGRCAQPCRLPYCLEGNPKDSQYLLSLKDLQTIDLLPQMLDAGTYSFKIEGRMKQTKYAYEVVSLYRKYLDLALESPERYKVSSEDKETLMKAGNRCGFTDGYLQDHKGPQMVTFQAPSHKKSGTENKNFTIEEKKIPIKAEADFVIGQRAHLLLQGKGIEVEVLGNVVDSSKDRPLTVEEVEKKISACGNTFFEMTDFKAQVEEQCFYPASELKKLRRQGIGALEEKLLRSHEISIMEKEDYMVNLPEKVNQKAALNVWVSNKEQFHLALESPLVDAIYLSFDLASQMAQELEPIVRAHPHKQFAVALPYVLKDQSIGYIKEVLTKFSHFSFIKYLVNDYDGLGLLDSMGIDKGKIICDAGMYTFSNYAIKALVDLGYQAFTLPYELNEKELYALHASDSEMVVYGYQPVMQSEQCVLKNTRNCHKDGKVYYLEDRKRQKMKIKPHCDLCYNTIYNSQPLCLFTQAEKIKKINVTGYRLQFLEESVEEMNLILKAYQQAFLDHQKVDLKQVVETYTNGHFKRGVE